MKVGYKRVSTADQNPERQLLDMDLDKVFTDVTSGKNADRPALQSCIEFVREGDVIYVDSIDRLARNLSDLLKLIDTINGKKVTLSFLKENMTFDGTTVTPMQNLYLQIMGAIAQFERALIRERQAEGVALAKEKGTYKGRVFTRSEKQMKAIVEEAFAKRNQLTAVSRKYKIHRTTIYRWAKLFGMKYE